MGPDLAMPARITGAGRAPSADDARLTIGLAAAVGVVIFAFFVFASAASPDTWVPVVVAIFLVAVSVPLCLHLGRGDHKLRKLLVAALLVKLAFVGPRYYVNEVVYAGNVDATRYDAAGGIFIEGFSRGEWTIEGSEIAAFPSETRFVGYVTGILYLAFGTSFVGGYLVYSWVAWLGLLAFLQSFRVAFPNAPPYFAAWLILFFPSMLFWPSSPGKDALMVFAVGAATYGATTIVHGRRWVSGAVIGGLGAWLLYSVRPHILLVVLAGVATALVARPRTERDPERATGRDVERRPFWPVLLRLTVLVLIVPALYLGFGAVDETLGGEDGDLVAALDTTAENTSIGDSAFEAAGVRSPADLPWALVSVPLRPFIFEARSPLLAMSAIEGTVLILAVLAWHRWIWMVVPAVRRSPLGAYCVGYTLAFVVAFSNIGNAGILSRQRVQLLPVLFLLAATARALFDERAQARSSVEATQSEPHPSAVRTHKTPELAWSRT